MPKFTLCYTRETIASTTIVVKAKDLQTACKEAEQRMLDDKVEWTMSDDYMLDDFEFSWATDKNGNLLSES